MMFTQEQINEIRQRLAISGTKDTQLPLAELPLIGEESVAIIQHGENKRVSIEEFYEEFSQYIDKSERVDLFNVSRYAQRISEANASVPLTLEEAVALCPKDVKRGGQILTFVDSSGAWNIWQYKGVIPENWSNIKNFWENIDDFKEFVTYIGSGTDYLNIINKDHKVMIANTASCICNVQFESVCNFIALIPENIIAEFTMGGIQVPMQYITDYIAGDATYNVYKSYNQYTVGTHAFTVSINSNTKEANV